MKKGFKVKKEYFEGWMKIENVKVMEKKNNEEEVLKVKSIINWEVLDKM